MTPDGQPLSRLTRPQSENRFCPASRNTRMSVMESGARFGIWPTLSVSNGLRGAAGPGRAGAIREDVERAIGIEPTTFSLGS